MDWGRLGWDKGEVMWLTLTMWNSAGVGKIGSADLLFSNRLYQINMV
jgi:hypothetical protein